MSKRVITAAQVLFVLTIAGVLCLSLARTVLFPKDVNTYENRTANKPERFSMRGFLSSSFQDSLENSLSDQVFRAETAKKYYNNFEAMLSYSLLKQVYAAHPNQYFRFNNIYVFDSDYLLYEPRVIGDEQKQRFDLKTASINSAAAAHPELDFYAYYIEKDTDINFETNEKCGSYEYIEAAIDDTNCKIGKYAIDSFAEFKEKFYRTDHHWNHIGSYDGYLQLCSFLDLENPLQKGEEFLVGEKLDGSKLKSAETTALWSEDLYAYHFDFPEMTITVNGALQEDYGLQNKQLDGDLYGEGRPTYAQYYGTDWGEIIFDTGKDNGNRILIIGESYDNAILKLLATHFSQTYSVDMRNYEREMGEPFDFDAYVEKYSIDKVLFIGNIDFYLLETFNVR